MKKPMTDKNKKIDESEAENESSKIDERPLSRINRSSMNRKGFQSLKGLPVGHPQRPGGKPGSVRLKNANDTRRLLAGLINEVRAGTLQPAVLKSVSYTCSILLKAVEIGTSEERLKQIEEVLEKRGLSR